MINNDGPLSLGTWATTAFRNFLAYLTLNKVCPFTSLPYLCSDIHKPTRQVTYPSPYTHLLSMFCQHPSLCSKNFNFLILSKWVLYVLNFFSAHAFCRVSFFRTRSVALRSPILLLQDWYYITVFRFVSKKVFRLNILLVIEKNLSLFWYE